MVVDDLLKAAGVAAEGVRVHETSKRVAATVGADPAQYLTGQWCASYAISAVKGTHGSISPP